MSDGKALSVAQRRQRQTASITHGLYIRSESGMRVRYRKVRRLVERMRTCMPWLADSDVPACRAWAELEYLGARMFAELEKGGIVTPDGEPRRLVTELRQLRQAQVAIARELGMTPAARMSLRVDDSRARSLDAVRRLHQAEGEDEGE